MASHSRRHSRRHSRGSIFSFTIDAVRSLSRVGSRQAIRLDDEDNNDHAVRRMPISETPPLGSREGPSLASPTIAGSADVPLDVTDSRRSRPLSWLHDPRPLVKKKRVDRSVSAPILTSTTNAKVAQTEGVRCGELVQADLVQSTWVEGVGWMPDNIEGKEKDGATSTAPATAKVLNDEFESLPRTNTLSRLKGAIKSQWKNTRHSSSSQQVRSSVRDGKISPVDGGIARRRAEAVSLCKDKIRELTGHGNIRRKPVGNPDKPSSLSGLRESAHDEQPLLRIESRLSNSKESEHAEINPDFTFLNLEQSFISAVNKIDFQSHSQPQDNARQASTDMPNSGRLSFLSGKYRKAKKNAPDAADLNEPAINAATAVPSTISGSQGTFAPLPTVEQLQRMNPLRCHPNVAGFARLPAPTGTPTANPDMSNSRIEIAKDEAKDLENVENVPIYSPSSGDLTQYGTVTASPTQKPTPSAQTAVALTRGNPYYTPTRTANARGTKEHFEAQDQADQLATFRNNQLKCKKSEKDLASIKPAVMHNAALMKKLGGATSGTFNQSPDDFAKPGPTMKHIGSHGKEKLTKNTPAHHRSHGTLSRPETQVLDSGDGAALAREFAKLTPREKARFDGYLAKKESPRQQSPRRGDLFGDEPSTKESGSGIGLALNVAKLTGKERELWDGFLEKKQEEEHKAVEDLKMTPKQKALWDEFSVLKQKEEDKAFEAFKNSGDFDEFTPVRMPGSNRICYWPETPSKKTKG